MGDDAKDPVDHARTTRPHAGESMKNTASMPALIVLGLGLVAFVSCLATLAAGETTVGVVLGCLAVLGFAVAGVWLMLEHRRVRRIEDRWLQDHPEAARQRPRGDTSS
ncbi:protein UsfY [Mycolicibacterium thermoresistibile]